MVAALHFVEEEVLYLIQATERPGNSIRGKIKDTLVPADDRDDDSGGNYGDDHGDDGEDDGDGLLRTQLVRFFYSILHFTL